MKFLLTNDDGIDAPGLAALAAAMKSHGDVTVVAPIEAHSGCGHQVTHHGQVRVQERGDNEFAVHGTPADCVRLGLLHLAGDVDWVVAGVNDGANLGIDVYMSGTVAAAREAAFLGTPAAAISQYRRSQATTDWEQTQAAVASIWPELAKMDLSGGALWNVNLPDPPTEDAALSHCPVDVNALPMSYVIDGEVYQYNGDYHNRPRHAESDVALCFAGHATVSRIEI